MPATLAPLPTDPDKLRQILINLIGNALKFTERGSVTVRVASNPANHHPVRIDVMDTGIGIPQEKLGVIFEAFQQADAGTARKYGGTGLGLTISQALCQLLGYRLAVSSKLDKGSTFSVVLQPPAEAEERACAPVPTAALDLAGYSAELKDKLVMVLDDKSDSRATLAQMVEEFGCQVIAASSGHQGLRMARELRLHFITADLLMPRRSGWQVVQAIKAERELRDIPAVVVSVVAGNPRTHSRHGGCAAKTRDPRRPAHCAATKHLSAPPESADGSG